MSNEIQLYKKNNWLNIKATSAAELALLKAKKDWPVVGARLLAKTQPDTIKIEFKDMLSRVAVLTGSENIKNPIIIDELITFFEENNEVYGLTLEDIYLCFKRGASGHYGKVYGQLKFTDLCEWLRAYESERIIAIETKIGTAHKTPDPFKRGESIRDYLRKP